MISATSGPPQGSVLGNALEKGGGYGVFFDHFGALCGMEVVLGTGELLRTGDGSLQGEDFPNWHLSKYSFGPILDGLFAQGSYGIVTRSGIWLAARPPAVRTFHFAFDADDDLGVAIDLLRPLKLSNFVPSLFRVMNDLYIIGAEEPSPEYEASKGKRAISNEGRRALQKKYRVGAWNVSGAFYGASMEALQPQVDRVRKHFEQSGRARFIDHDEALTIAPLQPAIDAFGGRPSSHELGLLKWRPGGGNAWFTPGTPISGPIMNEMQREGRAIYERYGMDYAVMNVCGARFARGLHNMTFNREDADECERADRCYRDIAAAFRRRGISVGRSPTAYQPYHMETMMPSFVRVCRDMKQVFDPNQIIAPGRYGI
jgi:4-cresol dehydrogenase (hydroxylating)